MEQMSDSLQAEIEGRVQKAFPGCNAEVSVDGNRVAIAVQSDQFAELNRVKRQQAVYACIEDLIAAGTVHAVTINAVV
tara:strand:+ start:497 stop:730 length:234 start_codon:yes stop_codon:yes gene_type:complete